MKRQQIISALRSAGLPPSEAIDVASALGTSPTADEVDAALMRHIPSDPARGVAMGNIMGVVNTPVTPPPPPLPAANQAAAQIQQQPAAAQAPQFQQGQPPLVLAPNQVALAANVPAAVQLGIVGMGQQAPVGQQTPAQQPTAPSHSHVGLWILGGIIVALLLTLAAFALINHCVVARTDEVKEAVKSLATSAAVAALPTKQNIVEAAGTVIEAVSTSEEHVTLAVNARATEIKSRLWYIRGQNNEMAEAIKKLHLAPPASRLVLTAIQVK